MANSNMGARGVVVTRSSHGAGSFSFCLEFPTAQGDASYTQQVLITLVLSLKFSFHRLEPGRNFLLLFECPI
jgi:hypothetical protein